MLNKPRNLLDLDTALMYPNRVTEIESDAPQTPPQVDKGSQEERVQEGFQEMAGIRLRNHAADGLETKWGKIIAGDGLKGHSVLPGGPPSFYGLRLLEKRYDD